MVFVKVCKNMVGLLENWGYIILYSSVREVFLFLFFQELIIIQSLCVCAGLGWVTGGGIPHFIIV